MGKLKLNERGSASDGNAEFHTRRLVPCSVFFCHGRRIMIFVRCGGEWISKCIVLYNERVVCFVTLMDGELLLRAFFLATSMTIPCFSFAFLRVPSQSIVFVRVPSIPFRVRTRVPLTSTPPPSCRDVS